MYGERVILERKAASYASGDSRKLAKPLDMDSCVRV